jgi:hypothetical protein
MASSDTRASYSNFSEDFAQTQDTAELWDPSDEAFANELQTAKAELDDASDELERASECGLPAADLKAAEQRYAAATEAWERLELELRSSLLQRPGYISLAQALGEDLDTGEELSPEDAFHRRDALEALFRYICQDGASNLGGCFKNFLALVRKIRPQALDGISQQDLAIMLDETKAAVSAREIRRVEKIAAANGVKGVLFLGGSKGMETRERCRQSARGNTNRATGAERKRRLAS